MIEGSLLQLEERKESPSLPNTQSSKKNRSKWYSKKYSVTETIPQRIEAPSTQAQKLETMTNNSLMSLNFFPNNSLQSKVHNMSPDNTKMIHQNDNRYNQGVLNQIKEMKKMEDKQSSNNIVKL